MFSFIYLFVITKAAELSTFGLIVFALRNTNHQTLGSYHEVIGLIIRAKRPCGSLVRLLFVSCFLAWPIFSTNQTNFVHVQTLVLLACRTNTQEGCPRLNLSLSENIRTSHSENKFEQKHIVKVSPLVTEMLFCLCKLFFLSLVESVLECTSQAKLISCEISVLKG